MNPPTSNFVVSSTDNPSSTTFTSNSSYATSNAMTQFTPSERQSLENLYQKVELYFNQTGEKEKLKSQLKNKLVESGWKLQMENKCEELLNAKGVANISVDQLMQELLPLARDTIPESLKISVLNQIKEIVDKVAQTI